MDPNDRILNTAQLRSAEYLRAWRSLPASVPISLEETIRQALENKQARDAHSRAIQAAKDAEKARKDEAKVAKMLAQQKGKGRGVIVAPLAEDSPQSAGQKRKAGSAKSVVPRPKRTRK